MTKSSSETSLSGEQWRSGSFQKFTGHRNVIHKKYWEKFIAARRPNLVSTRKPTRRRLRFGFRFDMVGQTPNQNSNEYRNALSRIDLPRSSTGDVRNHLPGKRCVRKMTIYKPVIQESAYDTQRAKCSLSSLT